MSAGKEQLLCPGNILILQEKMLEQVERVVASDGSRRLLTEPEKIAMGGGAGGSSV